MQTGPLQTIYRHSPAKNQATVIRLIRRLSFSFTKVEGSVVQAVVHPLRRYFTCHLAIFDEKTKDFLGTFTSKRLTLPDGTQLTIPSSLHNNLVPG